MKRIAEFVTHKNKLSAKEEVVLKNFRRYLWLLYCADVIPAGCVPKNHKELKRALYIIPKKLDRYLQGYNSWEC